jgi:hypothetical protein
MDVADEVRSAHERREEVPMSRPYTRWLCKCIGTGQRLIRMAGVRACKHM